MIRRPPRSTLDRSSAASDVYKRQAANYYASPPGVMRTIATGGTAWDLSDEYADDVVTVSYTHLRAHETVLDLVCRLLLEKKKSHNDLV